jgi:hypothetical protein
MKHNSQLNTILIEKSGKKSIKKERENELIRLTRQTRDPCHETRTTQ